jgi:heptosyltransferase-2
MNISAKPWSKKDRPKRILIIRWQAMGDVMITLPYLQRLRNSLPSSVQLDLLTREEVEGVPKSIDLFDRIWSIGGGRDHKKQLFYIGLLLPRLFIKRYDIIIDLQNNRVSETLRKILRPAAWSAFDRFSPASAGERNRATIEAVGLGECPMDNHFRLKDPARGLAILKDKGWNGTDKLVVLNPAGFVETRNWPIPDYIRFARLWLDRWPGTKFLILGVALIAGKAAALRNELGDHLLNLVGQTSSADAFAILQHASLVLSEDSGLMHMAWVSGIPTMVLFGSTRSDWSRPLGDHSFFLDSSDLPCGNCMQAVCRFGDVHCLTRYSPEQVQVHSLALLKNRENNKKIHPHAAG